ncbi:MAG: hypothetical protein IPI34_01025 [bacterium]|nr:hypothetical protein [bacterium]
MACPYSDSTSPDVVYSFTPMTDLVLTVDLCGSDTTPRPTSSTAPKSSPQRRLLLRRSLRRVRLAGRGPADRRDDVLRRHRRLRRRFRQLRDVRHRRRALPRSRVPRRRRARGRAHAVRRLRDEYNSGCNGALGNFLAIDWTNDEDGLPPTPGCAASAAGTSAPAGDSPRHRLVPAPP